MLRSMISDLSSGKNEMAKNFVITVRCNRNTKTPWILTFCTWSKKLKKNKSLKNYGVIR